MPKEIPAPMSHDGTSQSGRLLRELSPDYVLVDERTTRDLLAFVKAYARELRYFGLDDPDQPLGNWSAFVDSVDLEDAARYVEEPEKFPAEKAGLYARPHFALLLVFLKLLENARARTNALTRQHLEFFYSDVLGMVRKRAVPDKVHVLVELSSRTNELALPVGTALRAGKDSLGRDLVYRTERELIANRVQVKEIRSLRAEIRITSVKEAGRQYLVRRMPKEALLAMLGIALGQPNPGDPLPVSVYSGFRLFESPLSFDTLIEVDRLIGRVESELGMPFFDDLRELMMRWKRLRAEDGQQIDGLMDGHWERINELLERAGKCKRRDGAVFEWPPAVRTSPNFDDKFAYAVADVDPQFRFDGGLDNYFQTFLVVERYFSMPAEKFKFIMSVATQDAPAERDWEKVYDILAAAHREMIYARRRDALWESAKPGIDANNGRQALNKMLAVVFGEAIPVSEALQRLHSLGLTARDTKYLSKIADDTERSPDWMRVCKVLEVAQRNRENFTEPVAEKVVWRNVYPAADARAVFAQPEQVDEEDLPRWKTFGRVEASKAAGRGPQVVLGWAMTSALLVLEEGKRTITLKLGYSSDRQSFDPEKLVKLFAPAADAPMVARVNPFQLQLSTANGWVDPKSVRLSWTGQNMDYLTADRVPSPSLRELVFTCFLSENQPALAPSTLAVHGLNTPEPVLRLMLQPILKDEECNYQALRELSLRRVHLVVNVEGLTSLCIGNDQSTLDAKKPFEPFGANPSTGSRFYFGHREIVSKNLDKLSFTFTWMGAPRDLGKHYENYVGKITNESFTAKVSLSDGGVIKDSSPAITLFDRENATSPVKTTLTVSRAKANPHDVVTTSEDVTEWSRHLFWELGSPDFQHGVYPQVALERSLKMAAAVSAGPLTEVTQYQVNPPYTPKIKSLTVDYSASGDFDFKQEANDAATMRFFHIEPFGYAELKSGGGQSSFLPPSEFEGELYVGLRNVTAPQSVSLLFQVAEGSANPDLSPEPVQWSYLSGNRWLTLQDGSLISDGTCGLANSGIVQLSLKPARPSTRLPGDLYWLRAAIARSPDSVCDIVDVHPNAVLATFADDNNAPDHLRKPLPPGRIVGSVTPLPGATRMRQPYTSFGGRMAEPDGSFQVRVSERLRHRQRALTAWDYERLVLEGFPNIYKVKCLRGDAIAHPNEPGRIELIVIPDIRSRRPFNPFEPKATTDLIRDIETFLQDKIPPLASIRVKNARYVAVKVRCGVRFMSEQDEGYCRKRLNEELNRFLSPWAYDEGADIVIGDRIYANSIINFIDGRDYVDYVADFKLYTIDEKTGSVTRHDGDHVPAPTPDSVLVAGREHVFHVISKAEYPLEDLTGINYMTIGLDFIVG